MVNAFLSYGGPDETFARELARHLEGAGVTTFFFPISAQLGRRLHHVMRDGVQSADRILLLCSKQSLDRPGVLNEIEEALSREASEGGRALLIPIALDDYVFNEWSPREPGLAIALRQRVIANFKNIDLSGLHESDQFKLLLHAINADFASLPLKYSSFMNVTDIMGRRAIWTISKSHLVNMGTIDSFTFNDIDVTGRIVGVTSEDGATKLTSRGGSKTVDIKFPKKYYPGEVINMSIQLELQDCHTSDTEDLRSRFVSAFRSATWRVFLPSARPALHIECYSIQGNRRMSFPTEFDTSPRDGFGMTVLNPPLGAYYCVDWRW